MKVELSIFYRVPQFKYLWVLINQDNKFKAEISGRVQIVNKCYFEAIIILKSKSTSKNLKLKNVYDINDQ